MTKSFKKGVRQETAKVLWSMGVPFAPAGILNLIDDTRFAGWSGIGIGLTSAVAAAWLWHTSHSEADTQGKTGE